MLRQRLSFTEHPNPLVQTLHHPQGPTVTFQRIAQRVNFFAPQFDLRDPGLTQFVTQKHTKQAIPYVVQALLLNELGNFNTGSLISGKLHYHLVKAFWILVSNFKDYLGATPEKKVETNEEHWAAITARVFLSYALRDPEYIAGFNKADEVFTQLYQIVEDTAEWGRGSWEEDYEIVKARLNDRRKETKCLKEFRRHMVAIANAAPSSKDEYDQLMLPAGSLGLWFNAVQRAAYFVESTCLDECYSTIRDLPPILLDDTLRRVMSWRISRDLDLDESGSVAVAKYFECTSPQANPHDELFEPTEEGLRIRPLYSQL